MSNLLNALSKEGRKHVADLCRASGVPEEMAIMTIAEVVIPNIDPARFAEAVRASEMAWILLSPGESTVVGVPTWKEARFRNRLSTVGRRTGMRFSASFEYPDVPTDPCRVTVTNMGQREVAGQRPADGSTAGVKMF